MSIIRKQISEKTKYYYRLLKGRIWENNYENAKRKL